MLRSMMAAVFAAAFAVPSLALSPSSPPGFEATLGAFQAGLAIRSAAERAARAKSAADDLAVEAKNAGILAQEAWQLRSLLADARRRAASAQRGGDITLPSDLSRLVYYLNAWTFDCQQVDGDLQRLAGEVSRDPSLVAAARKLEDAAAKLDSESGYLAIEARSASFELAAAGYGGQAYYIQQYAQAAAQLSADIHAQAGRILGRVGS